MKTQILIVLLISSIILSGCVDQVIVDSFEQKYGGEIDSLRYDIKIDTYSDTFKVCKLGESENCQSKSYREFDNLKKVRSLVSNILLKQPDKSLMIRERDDYENKKFDHIQANLCIGTTLKGYDTDISDSIIVKEDFKCKNSLNLISTNQILTIAKKINSLGLNVRKTSIDGREVIEIHNKEKKSRPYTETENWMYFDANTYAPIKGIETRISIFDKLIDGEEVTHIELTKHISEFKTFEINSVLDNEFTLPELKNLIL